MEQSIIDGFRFIGNLHTTARQLSICSQIVKEVGDKNIPEKILSLTLASWSNELELKNEDYKFSRGKLTQNNKITHALKHYFSLCSSLGLLLNFNGVFSSSKTAKILLYFISNLDNTEFSLSKEEKAFFFFQLLKIDADGILFLIDILENKPQGISQKNLQLSFQTSFNLRLISKETIASGHSKLIISEKYRLINYIWKKPTKYSEHLLIPRCEWLKSLGFIEIIKSGSSTIYSLSEKGISLLDFFPKITNSGLRDINNEWINKKFFSLISNLIYDFGSNLEKFNNRKDKEELLVESLIIAKTKVGLSSSFKMPLYETLLFISFYHLLKKGVITEFYDSIQVLKKGLKLEGNEFLVKEEGRINEGYISIRKYL